MTQAGLTSDVVLGSRRRTTLPVRSTTDACSAITNGAAVAGKIAIVDRGTCGFTIKVKNAQNAGAIGVVVGNTSGRGAFGMAGVDATITIPSSGSARPTASASPTP